MGHLRHTPPYKTQISSRKKRQKDLKSQKSGKIWAEQDLCTHRLNSTVVPASDQASPHASTEGKDLRSSRSTDNQKFLGKGVSVFLKGMVPGWLTMISQLSYICANLSGMKWISGLLKTKQNKNKYMQSGSQVGHWVEHRSGKTGGDI